MDNMDFLPPSAPKCPQLHFRAQDLYRPIMFWGVYIVNIIISCSLSLFSHFWSIFLNFVIRTLIGYSYLSVYILMTDYLTQLWCPNLDGAIKWRCEESVLAEDTTCHSCRVDLAQRRNLTNTVNCNLSNTWWQGKGGGVKQGSWGRCWWERGIQDNWDKLTGVAIDHFTKISSSF